MSHRPAPATNRAGDARPDRRRRSGTRAAARPPVSAGCPAAAGEDRTAGSPGPDRDEDDPAPSIAVPHLIGHHVDVALRHIEDLGLRARVLTTEVHDKTDRHVVSTRPAPGTDVSEDRTVEVVIGIAPLVDDYVGCDVHEAVRIAELGGHVVDVVVDGTGPASGPVRHQDPEPGRRQRVVTLRVAARSDSSARRTGTPG